MAIEINEEALKQAADDMQALRERNDQLKTKLENMYNDLLTALDTPAGNELKICGLDVIIGPIEDMGLVIDHVSTTLNKIIGQGGEPTGTYYDKLFDDYEELDHILRNKTTQ